MEPDRYEMLDLLSEPAICVKDGIILQANHAAMSVSLVPGMEILPLLLTGEEEYRAFTGGCLSLQLSLMGAPANATVTALHDTHIFLLEPDCQDEDLRTLALAARELRQPLSNLIATTETMLPRSLTDPASRESLARLSRGLYQMERTIGNMADAGMGGGVYQPEYRDIPSIFEEIFQKAEVLLSAAGATISYTGLNKELYGLIDARQMERAVLNILSNSLKFKTQGCEIQATLTRQGNSIRLRVQDNGPGIERGILGSLFSRHRRQPGLEDSRFGMGLGMGLIRSAAVNHGGTVLVDLPEECGTRVTLTMRIRKPSGTMVRTPMVFLSGGRDMGLTELSQCLPLRVYEKNL